MHCTSWLKNHRTCYAWALNWHLAVLYHLGGIELVFCALFLMHIATQLQSTEPQLCSRSNHECKQDCLYVCPQSKLLQQIHCFLKSVYKTNFKTGMIRIDAFELQNGHANSRRFCVCDQESNLTCRGPTELWSWTVIDMSTYWTVSERTWIRFVQTIFDAVNHAKQCTH